MNLKEALAEITLSKDLAQFYHRWSMTQAKGFPLQDTLRSFGKNAPPSITSRISCILQNLKEGRELYHDNSYCFTEIEIAFLEVGFSTGKLEEALQALHNLYNREWLATRRRKGKLTYPMFVCFLGCWILPVPLIFYLGLWFWIIISGSLSFALFSFGGWLLLLYFQRLRNKPKAVHSRFFGGLAMTLEAGCSLHEALQLAVKIAQPSPLADRLKYIVPDGKPLVDILRNTRCFSQNILLIVETGEASGKLPESLRQLSNNIEYGLI